VSTFESISIEAKLPLARPALTGRRGVLRVVPHLIITLVGLLACLLGLGDSGTLWPDDARYLNGAVMIRDWLASGEWGSPMQFAMRHYAQYPGFSIPYHPPAYPGLLGIWFLITGVSYESARVFVALCLVGGGIGMMGIARSLGAPRITSLLTALLLMVCPAIVHWSRSTMSDIPALAFILLATGCFLKWCDSHRSAWCYAAFALAEVAFLSRVTTAGVLPAWFAYLLLRQGWSALKSFSLIGSAAIYLIANAGWVVFVSAFAVHELTTDGELQKDVAFWSWDNFGYYLLSLPAAAGWLTVAAACAALALGWRWARARAMLAFGLAWFIAYYLFQLTISAIEDRYFLFALPGLCFIAAAPLAGPWAIRLRSPLVAGSVLVVLTAGATQSAKVPHGITGYHALANRLGQMDESGNVLMCTWVDQDFIFHYRAMAGTAGRSLIRGDRTLSIRVSEYARQDPTILAQTGDEVLRVLERGRIRYMITCSPTDPSSDTRDHEMILAHRTAMSRGDRFELIEQFPLRIEIGSTPRESRVCLWRYTGQLPDGPSEIPVLIPTAQMTIWPSQQSR
jgi:4-amino-4-deoxy-L-arabinose transferase-like glycosyltransferase